MPESEFAGLLPENFDDFRSVEFWDGFFKARGNKVRMTQQCAVGFSAVPMSHHGVIVQEQLVWNDGMDRPLSGMANGSS